MSIRESIKGVAVHLYRRLNRWLALRSNAHAPSDLRVGIGTLITAPDEIRIGSCVKIGSHCFIACNGSIGAGVLISSQVGIVGRGDHDDQAVGRWISEAPWIYDENARPRTARDEVIVEDDVWVGFGAIILSGVRIGRGSIVGAGAVVTSDVAAYNVVVGNPARSIGSRFTPNQAESHEELLALKRGIL